MTERLRRVEEVCPEYASTICQYPVCLSPSGDRDACPGMLCEGAVRGDLLHSVDAPLALQSRRLICQVIRCVPEGRQAFASRYVSSLSISQRARVLVLLEGWSVSERTAYYAAQTTPTVSKHPGLAAYRRERYRSTHDAVVALVLGFCAS